MRCEQFCCFIAPALLSATMGAYTALFSVRTLNIAVSLVLAPSFLTSHLFIQRQIIRLKRFTGPLSTPRAHPTDTVRKDVKALKLLLNEVRNTHWTKKASQEFLHCILPLKKNNPILQKFTPHPNASTTAQRNDPHSPPKMTFLPFS